MFNRIALTALALGIAASASAPALAKTEIEKTETVAIDDLNLTTEAGRATMERRLDRAVRSVCGDRPALRDLPAWADYRGCIAGARESYKEQVRVALNKANARRVAVLADKLGLVAIR
ncbi:MAG: UrcA family protein [Pseudomonadota bacterium]